MSDFWIMRGERVIQSLNEASTEPELYDKTVAGFPDTKKRQHSTNTITISNVQYIPFVGTKMLHIKTTAMSNGSQYAQGIQILRVPIHTQEQEGTIAFTGSDGKLYFTYPLDLNKHNVKVRCSCLDFYWRFAKWNYSDKSVIGPAPRPYVRKTDTRPPVNPTQTPGLCKHLMKAFDQLHADGLVMM